MKLEFRIGKSSLVFIQGVLYVQMLTQLKKKKKLRSGKIKIKMVNPKTTQRDPDSLDLEGAAAFPTRNMDLNNVTCTKIRKPQQQTIGQRESG